jgi:hypothetical protein
MPTKRCTDRRHVVFHRYYCRVFESIFTPRGVRIHRSTPLLGEREEFLTYLRNRGTGRHCLRIYASRLNLIVRFLRLERMRAVRRAEILAAARKWAAYHNRHRHLASGPASEAPFIWLAQRWLKFLGKLTPPPRGRPAFGLDLSQYAEYMRSERRLSPITVENRLLHARHLLEWLRANRSLKSLRLFSLSHLDRYFIAKSNRWSIVSIREL